MKINFDKAVLFNMYLRELKDLDYFIEKAEERREELFRLIDECEENLYEEE